jgi:DNA ligase-1
VTFEPTFKPMLAAKCGDPGILKFPLMVSPKLDGVRATVVGRKLLTRSLKSVPNHHIYDVLSRAEYEGLDGELVVGETSAKDCFNRSTSAIMSRDGAPDFKFWVFDNAAIPHTSFQQRYASVATFFGSKPPFIESVPHFMCHTAQDLIMFENTFVSQGYEGLMIRSLTGPYKYGRSTEREGYLLKLKRFADSEAEVIGYEERMHNANEATINELGYAERSSHKENQVPTGTLGALHVRDIANGWEFKIGTGFTEHQRHKFWELREVLKGRIVKYRYQPAGMKDVPRFPAYLGFRDVRDM